MALSIDSFHPAEAFESLCGRGTYFQIFPRRQFPNCNGGRFLFSKIDMVDCDTQSKSPGTKESGEV
jgi:hypothetical protein